MATESTIWQTFPRAHRAAQRSRRMFGIFRTGRSSTSLNISEGKALEEVVHDFVRNVPWIESYLSSWVSHTVGTGISPHFAASDETERAELRRWFRSWAQETDADGRLSLHGQTALVSRLVARDGEVFARLRPRRLSDGLSTPLQIQVIPAAQVPRAKMDGGLNDNSVIGGIERNAIGKRVAYHVYPRHPGDPQSPQMPATLDTVRVPAEQMLHIGMPAEAGEMRQVSILRSALLTLKGLSDTNDNTIEMIRVRSLLTALFSNPLDERQPPQPMGATEPNADGIANTFEFEAGTIMEMPPGSSIEFPPAPDVGTAYADYSRMQLQNFAALVGLTYPELSFLCCGLPTDGDDRTG